jgi:4-hydroxy-3-methylbut-2-enyl diphosphate reductase
MKPEIDILLASPRGFCAGVVRAIETVKRTLVTAGPPVYVLHEIVHNKHVIRELESLGTRFVKELNEIPRGGICIFSAHGVSMETEKKASLLGLRTVDATCPLVRSIHRMVELYQSKEYDVIIIGHHGHPEVVGTSGRVTGRVHVVANEDEAKAVQVIHPTKVAYVTQTTLSQSDVVGIRSILEQRFKEIKGPIKSNICYATQNRQNSVKRLAQDTDLVFVVGSKNSSNSNRLREVAQRYGQVSYLIDDSSDIELSWFEGVSRIGITAGASAPERLVEDVLAWLGEHFSIRRVAEMSGIKEHIHFEPAQLDSEGHRSE